MVGVKDALNGGFWDAHLADGCVPEDVDGLVISRRPAPLPMDF